MMWEYTLDRVMRRAINWTRRRVVTTNGWLWTGSIAAGLTGAVCGWGLRAVYAYIERG